MKGITYFDDRNDSKHDDELEDEMGMNTANSCFTDSMLSAIQPRTDDCSSKGNRGVGGGGGVVFVYLYTRSI